MSDSLDEIGDRLLGGTLVPGVETDIAEHAAVVAIDVPVLEKFTGLNVAENCPNKLQRKRECYGSVG